MMFLARLVISAMSLGLAALLVPGFHINDGLTLFEAAFLLGIINAIVKPILIVLTFPITLLTLGLFLMVINAGMIALTAWMLPGFTIDGFGSALLGWLMVAIVSSLATRLL